MRYIILTGFFMLGNWLLDVGHNAYFSGGGLLTNGFWSYPALETYHFGWYLSIACFFIAIYWGKEEEFKNEETNNKD